MKCYYLISANWLSCLALGLMEASEEKEAGGEQSWKMLGTWYGRWDGFHSHHSLHHHHTTRLAQTPPLFPALSAAAGLCGQPLIPLISALRIKLRPLCFVCAVARYYQWCRPTARPEQICTYSISAALDSRPVKIHHKQTEPATNHRQCCSPLSADCRFIHHIR